MGSLIGDKLIKGNKISNDQLMEALEYQRINGGRLGNSLAALGFLDKVDVEAFFKPVPGSPENFEQTGLTRTYIMDLVLKQALSLREFSLADLGNRTKLPLFLIDDVIETLRKDHLVQVQSAGQLSKLSYTFCLSEAGIQKARELMRISRYIGPAPVSFIDYRNMVEAQTIKSIDVDEGLIRKALSDLVMTEDTINRLGPAISAGRSIFFYGPPGNGKTTVAEIIGNVMPDAIYVPYAVDVNGEVISLFDRATHREISLDEPEEGVDQRWVKVRRPVILAGGEMTLSSLDLDFNPISKYYEAPLQMKANNGIFIVDDFGRQQVTAKTLLNRWIVPLERRTDFLTLHTGMKIEIPFDQLVIFSTNLEPKNLVDQAFLRRIRYKIKIDYPELKEFKKIFIRVCKVNRIEYREDMFEFLINDLYKKTGTPLSACHCRDLIEWVVDHAHYRKISPELTKETLIASWKSYFVDM